MTIELYLGRLPGEDRDDREDRIYAAVKEYTDVVNEHLNVAPEYHDDVRDVVRDMVQRVGESLRPDYDEWLDSAGSITLERLDPGSVVQRGDWRYPSDDLAEIVRDGGDLAPIAAGERGGTFFVLDGHHRLRAYKMAGAQVPALVGRVTDGPEKTVYLGVQERTPNTATLRRKLLR